jgi:hypothetical protein
MFRGLRVLERRRARGVPDGRRARAVSASRVGPESHSAPMRRDGQPR